MRTQNIVEKDRSRDAGAALVTVLIITLLLGTACIAMLSAAGASSTNNSDALSEAKAYYAAESGLQATINVLRNNNVSYSNAVAHPSLAYDAASFPGGLAYATGTVSVGTEAKYTLNVVDPDASLPYNYYTVAKFTKRTGSPAVAGSEIPSPNAVPNVSKLCIPTCLAGTRTEITFDNTVSATNRTAEFTSSPRVNPALGTFSVTKVGGGAAIPDGVEFRVNYILTSPRPATRTIRGTVATSAAANPVVINWPSQEYLLLGSEIELCNQDYSTVLTPPSTMPADACTNFSFSLGAASTLRANITNVEPYRLLITSVGYGPNGAEKHLEGVIQKNIMDDLASTSAIAMIGPAAGMVFDAGTGAPTYCGTDGGYVPGQPIPNTPPCTPNPNSTTGPSIGYTDPAAAAIVAAGSTHATLNPPPDLITDVPEWQQTPASMDQFINSLRVAAQNNGHYLADTGQVKVLNTGDFGNRSTGLGLTFCEGDCRVNGSDTGGGTLVVTGRFEYSGNMSYNGLIIVTGAGGMYRNGSGGGQIIGNVVIAPYNLATSTTTFLPPQFSTNGGGNADIVFGGTSVAFDGTQAFTNLMIGVAEK